MLCILLNTNFMALDFNEGNIPVQTDFAIMVNCMIWQRLQLVADGQHYCLLGTGGIQHPCTCDTDRDPKPSGAVCTQPVQCGGLQDALAEERRPPVCQG